MKVIIESFMLISIMTKNLLIIEFLIKKSFRNSTERVKQYKQSKSNKEKKQ